VTVYFFDFSLCFFEDNHHHITTIIMSGVVTLRSSDDKTITVDKRVALLSLTIKDMLDGFDDHHHRDTVEVPVSVRMDILKRVIEWMKRPEHLHPFEAEIVDEDAPPPLPVLDEWNTQFCDGFDDLEKADMILAANYLFIKPLLDILCYSVANLTRGQTPEEVRKVVQRTTKPIPADLTPQIILKKIRDREQKEAEALALVVAPSSQSIAVGNGNGGEGGGTKRRR